MTDRLNHQVLVYAPEGDMLYSFGRAGSGAGHLNRPTGIAYDPLRDRVLVTDKDNHRVQVFTPQGQFITQFGSRGKRDGQFLYPWGIALSRCGTLIVIADSRNHRLQLFTSNGHFVKSFLGFEYPRGVAFSLNGKSTYTPLSTSDHLGPPTINMTLSY